MDNQSKDKAVCRCRKVYFEDLERVIKEGASSFEEVKEKTNVAGGCGRCEKNAKEIIEYLLKQN